MSKWLDTETKALLQPAPPEKLSPADTDAFTLVLLKKGENVAWVTEALAKLPDTPLVRAMNLASQVCPVVVADHLSLYDAMLGQFELVCCDSVSIFLRDEVVECATGDYLPQLYSRFQWSEEFENISVNIDAIPANDLGKRVIRQFFGNVSYDIGQGFAFRGDMMRKKARILTHWIRKLGVNVILA